MDDLVLSFLDVTSKAAIASYGFIGRGSSVDADRAAVDAMRSLLNKMDYNVLVAIGEGERDKAPMLFQGEKLGHGSTHLDIAVDPLECTDLCARGCVGSLCVIAVNQGGTILRSKDVYMEKIVLGYDLEESFFDNTRSLVERTHQAIDYIKHRKKTNLDDISITMLDRPRHRDILKIARDASVKVKLIEDGDVYAAIDVLRDKSDLYVGIGGAPEGVIASAAINTLGGSMFTRLMTDDEPVYYANKLNNQLVQGGRSFVILTGVTGCADIDPLIRTGYGNFLTHSMIIDSEKENVLFSRKSFVY